MKGEMYGREFMYGPDTSLERERFIKECSERHIRDGDMLLAMLFTELDMETKNPHFLGCQYDLDTIQGIPNFPSGKYAVNVGKKEYMGYIYDEFIKVPEDGYYAYDFALVNNGKVIAIGDEQGRCGGVTYSCRDKNFEDRLKLSSVYNKVKHLPIAMSEELEEPIYKYFNSHDEYERYMEQIKTKK
jgi:hypothetical protein